MSSAVESEQKVKWFLIGAIPHINSNEDYYSNWQWVMALNRKQAVEVYVVEHEETLAEVEKELINVHAIFPFNRGHIPTSARNWLEINGLV